MITTAKFCESKTCVYKIAVTLELKPTAAPDHDKDPKDDLMVAIVRG